MSKSKPVISKNNSQLNLNNVVMKPNSTINNFLKKNRRHSQDRIVYWALEVYEQSQI